MSYDPRLYAAVHDGTAGDLSFYRRVCANVRSVLELGCGYGRVLEALAGRVPRLVGLDLDPELLALAASRLEGAPLDLVVADMRAFDLEERFDRVLIPHSGLLCLLDDDALDDCLRCVHRHLTPRGRLALDVYDADTFHAEGDTNEFGPEALVFVKTVEVDGRRFEVFERSTWDRERQRIDATYVHRPQDGGPAVEGTIRQRYLLRDQLLTALARAHLHPVEIGAGFEGDDDALVVVARRSEAQDAT